MEVDLSKIIVAEAEPEAGPDDAWPEIDPALEAQLDSMPDPVPAPTPEQDDKYGQDRRRLILILQMYLNEFPKKLSAYKSLNLEKLSTDELKKLREEIDYVLGAKQNISAGVAAICTGIEMLETVAVNFTPLRVQGLSQINKDEEALDDMKCVCIKYMDAAHVEPEVRLGLRVLKTAFQLHTMNSMLERGSGTGPAKVNLPTMPDKFASL